MEAVMKKLLCKCKSDTIIEILDADALEKYIKSDIDNIESIRKITILKTRYEDLINSKIIDLFTGFKIDKCFTTEKDKSKVVILLKGREERIASLKKRVEKNLVTYIETL